ncbi:MAG: ECF transporter S component [bacterium]|nr:ECF transporter S component [bacterium]
MSPSPLRILTLSGLLTAMVTVATLAIRFPVAATQGYINFGDTLIFVTALLMGPRFGLLAGGVGSALADTLGGYAQWAPATLVIKGLEGYIVGAIGYRVFQARRRVTPTVVGAALVGGLWMVTGYFLAGQLFYRVAAVAEVPGNILQAVVSAAVAMPLLHALRRVKLLG